MRTLPTLRDKKRYLAFEIISEKKIVPGELSKEIFNSICSLFGDVGCSEIDPRLISCEGGYGIIRCARGKTEEARAALACINSINGGRVTITVLGISGTIKSAMEKFIQQTLI
ncbi:MAG TPA: Rpp14/Pop5 family protein [Candidatus Methanoperedens sp.]